MKAIIALLLLLLGGTASLFCLYLVIPLLKKKHKGIDDYFILFFSIGTVIVFVLFSLLVIQFSII